MSTKTKDQIKDFHNSLSEFMLPKNLKVLNKEDYYLRRTHLLRNKKNMRLSFLLKDLLEVPKTEISDKLYQIKEDFQKKFTKVFLDKFPDNGLSYFLVPKLRNFLGYRIISDLPSIETISSYLVNFGNNSDYNIRETIMGDCSLTDLVILEQGYRHFNLSSENLNGKIILYDAGKKDDLDFILLRLDLDNQ